MKICLFADVYGFSSEVFRSTADVAKSLEQLISTIRENFESLRKSLGGLGSGEVASELYVFSDNIVLTLDLGALESLDERLRAWSLFQAFCIDTYVHSFDKGMPLRGAVSAGDIEFSENIVVGEAVIEAVNMEKAVGIPILFLPEVVLKRLISRDVIPHHKKREFYGFLVDIELESGVVSGIPLLPVDCGTLVAVARKKYLSNRQELKTARPAATWKRLLEMLEGRIEK